MSALAKPHVFFSTAQGTGASDILIPAEQILSVEKVDLPAINNDPAKSQILVVLLPSTGAQPMTFTFVDATARNTAFSAAKTLLSASL